MQGDTEAQADRLAAKIAKLRIFRDDAGKMNLSVRDMAGAALVVSQFTLAADLRGNRPGFSTAAAPDEGKRLYDHFTAQMGAEGIPTANGQFGADMAVSLVNDGPVTIWLDTDDALDGRVRPPSPRRRKTRPAPSSLRPRPPSARAPTRATRPRFLSSTTADDTRVEARPPPAPRHRRG